VYFSRFVHFVNIWYIFSRSSTFCDHLVYFFPVLVCFTEKNLATLIVVPFPGFRGPRKKIYFFCEKSARFKLNVSLHVVLRRPPELTARGIDENPTSVALGSKQGDRVRWREKIAQNVAQAHFVSEVMHTFHSEKSSPLQQ
jgi:CRISPR/Cas system endoribonuclease Cas6 (RAMP superfamily)